MTLSIGTDFGPYRITAELGHGGMGVVYRASDTRLSRDVALKVLNEEFALDSQGVDRFRREAKLLASLNHPNIAAIYDIEESDGIQALVLELVEGPTLAERITHGPVPLKEALPIAKQITDALEAAHEHAVIHRDLKPANIKVRDEGTVKILDFGLAKIVDPAPADRTTLTVPLTEDGAILGTPAYMSPEQANGLKVDKRTDIWAFGCVLYEMLTGQRAFPGTTRLDVLTAIRNRDPDWMALPSGTPSTIRVLLRRCLKKELKQRLHDIGDARIEIEDAQNAPPHDESIHPSTFEQRWRIVAAVVFAFLIGIAGAILTLSRNLTSPNEGDQSRAATEATLQSARFDIACETASDGAQLFSIENRPTKDIKDCRAELKPTLVDPANPTRFLLEPADVKRVFRPSIGCGIEQAWKRDLGQLLYASSSEAALVFEKQQQDGKALMAIEFEVTIYYTPLNASERPFTPGRSVPCEPPGVLRFPPR